MYKINGTEEMRRKIKISKSFISGVDFLYKSACNLLKNT